MNSNAWEEYNNEHKAERKKQWRLIKKRLNLFSKSHPDFKRAHHKYHQQLFFTGKVDSIESEPKAIAWEDLLNTNASSYVEALNVDPPSIIPKGDNLYTKKGIRRVRPFTGFMPIFVFWYAPVLTESTIEKIKQYIYQKRKISAFQGFLISTLYPTGADPVYGLMNGREESLANFFFPHVDYKQEIVDEPKGFQKLDFSDWNPQIILSFVLRSSLLELAPLYYAPYMLGQYLWDHLAYSIEHYSEKVITGDKYRDRDRKRLLRCMAYIFHFDQRSDVARERKPTINFVSRILSKYENKQFPPKFIELMDEAKKNMQEILEDDDFKLYEYQVDRPGPTTEVLEQWKLM